MGTPASPTTTTGRHDIAEILLKVALNTLNKSIKIIKSSAVSFRCFVDNFDVLSTKEQLVDESLGEAFLGGPKHLAELFRLPPPDD
jgi:hypothetical protein